MSLFHCLYAGLAESETSESVEEGEKYKSCNTGPPPIRSHRGKNYGAEKDNRVIGDEERKKGRKGNAAFGNDELVVLRQVFESWLDSSWRPPSNGQGAQMEKKMLS